VPRFEPRPPTDNKPDEGEEEEHQPIGGPDSEANEAINRAVAAILAAVLLAGLALGGWMFTHNSNPGTSGNAGPTSVPSTTAPPVVKTSFLEIAGSTPLNGPIVVSTVYCSVPAYDPNSYEIDADATIGGTKVLLTALTNGSALGLPATSTYFDIHIDLAKSASDDTGWVSNQKIAIFGGHNSVTIDGHLLAGPVAGGADVGRIDSTTLTCPH
jgi:hypothetical protein